MSGAEALEALTDALPESVRAHPGLPVVLAHLRGLDEDAALHHLYLEWNPLDGHLDPSFVLPTRAFGAIRLPLEDVTAEVTTGLPEDAPGARLLRASCRRMAARAADDRLYPRAVSVSLEGATEGFGDVALVFSDLGPPVDLAAEPIRLEEAFADLAPPEADATAQDLEALAPVAAGLRLDHVGVGYRRGQPIHKVYLGGRMRALVDRLLEPRTAPLVGAHGPELIALADRVGGRPAVMVVDATGGRVVRVGFELGLDVAADGPAAYADAVFAEALWSHAPETLTRSQGRLRGPPVERPLPGGYAAVLETSHLKVSFRGGPSPEWKAYLRIQKVFGTGKKASSTSDRCA